MYLREGGGWRRHRRGIGTVTSHNGVNSADYVTASVRGRVGVACMRRGSPSTCSENGPPLESMPLPRARWQRATEQVVGGGPGEGGKGGREAEKASDLRARARRSGGEHESYE